MFIDFDDGSGVPAWNDALDANESLLLWSIRHMAVAWPRCHSVHIALQQAYGCDGMGVEHLLRCWLTALSQRSVRRLTIGEPACSMLLPDEATLLMILRRAGNGSGEASAALATLTGAAATHELEDLAAMLASLALHHPRGRARR